MKRLISILTCCLLLASCSDNRSNVLKVYNWSTYIDESLIPEFEQWYEEQTGEKVTVIYQTFDVLETMLSKIEKGHEDYDVVCPSDYIIERMVKEDLLLPLDKNFGSTPNYIDSNISPFIKAYFDKFDCGGKNANDYSAGYMWGTTGILYNAGKVTREEASTWECLRNPKFNGQIFIKDASRDVISQIIIHLNKDAVDSGKRTLDELMFDSSDSTLNAVENFLADCKQHVAGWEADFGKEQMVKERALINLNWSGDSQWAIEEAAELGVKLDFVCPKEGFTIFFDGWVIPKYARNIKAANYWINFLCREDVAIRNSKEIGYVSVCRGEQMLQAYTDSTCTPIDATYFFGPGAESVCLNQVKYPDINTIKRSTLEHDWGEKTHLLIELWSRVKGSDASGWTTTVILVFIFGIGAFAVYSRFFSRTSRRKDKRHNRVRHK